MPDPHQAVIGGIDCHTDFCVVAALDPLGRVLGTESFPATGAGYRLTHTWLASFGSIAAVAVESTGSFGAALMRSLVERGCRCRVARAVRRPPGTRGPGGRVRPTAPRH